MALHPDFPDSPHAIVDPSLRWFPADEALRESTMEKLMPPLVPQLRRKVKEFRDSGYVGAADTSVSLLNWWFNTPHLIETARADDSASPMTQFQYYFAQRETLETIVYLYDVMGFDSSRPVSAGMFDESWRRGVGPMRGRDGDAHRLQSAARLSSGVRI